MPKHSIVWVDHREARVFQIDPHTVDEATIPAPTFSIYKHSKSSGESAARASDAEHFFQDIARALDESSEVLIVGPSSAKLELVKYAREHDVALGSRIVGAETMHYPTSRQMVAYARRYFYQLN